MRLLIRVYMTINNKFNQQKIVNINRITSYIISVINFFSRSMRVSLTNHIYSSVSIRCVKDHSLFNFLNKSKMIETNLISLTNSNWVSILEQTSEIYIEVKWFNVDENATLKYSRSCDDTSISTKTRTKFSRTLSVVKLFCSMWELKWFDSKLR